MPPSPWSGLSLNLKQFYTMFPHTPDNSFMGFVVEQGSKTMGNLTELSRKPIALLYAKKYYMLQPTEVVKLITILTEYFEVHATVADARSALPRTIINHGLLAGTAYMNILRSSKIFVGVGFPYEGPAPLEAIANGVIFVNPSFNPPKSRYNTDFFSSKPTSRGLTSQHPYIENFIGEPYSYTVDIRNETAVRELFLRLQNHPKPLEYVPFELTTAGMMERLRAYLTHQNFCPELPPPLHFTPNSIADVNINVASITEFQQADIAPIRPAARWPPIHSSLTILLGKPGASCSATCHAHRSHSNASSRFICCSEHFKTFNDHVSLRRLNLPCRRIFMRSHLAVPALSTSGQACYLQANDLLFDCEAPGELSVNLTVRRICPCRDALPGQWALCRNCL
uniref:alpha-1,6-mannosyl-glycoprotein 6-beta-N-acetylglucosaminyltransferase n=1 Tax=Schistocephalus solidus TaxID=70667 RepID=A0A0V0J159_SCHSO